MSKLSKIRIVKHRVDTFTVGYEKFCVDEDPGLVRATYIETDQWEQMGSPEYITVTVEPGDLLNEASR